VLGAFDDGLGDVVKRQAGDPRGQPCPVGPSGSVAGCW